MGLILLAAFIGIPILEIAVFIQAGELIGLWPTLAAIVVTAVIGAALVRIQGFSVLMRARKNVDAGRLPDPHANGQRYLRIPLNLEQPTDASGPLRGGDREARPHFQENRQGGAAEAEAEVRVAEGRGGGGAVHAPGAGDGKLPGELDIFAERNGAGHECSPRKSTGICGCVRHERLDGHLIRGVGARPDRLGVGGGGQQAQNEDDQEQGAHEADRWQYRKSIREAFPPMTGAFPGSGTPQTGSAEGRLETFRQ